VFIATSSLLLVAGELTILTGRSNVVAVMHQREMAIIGFQKTRLDQLMVELYPARTLDFRFAHGDVAAA